MPQKLMPQELIPEHREHKSVTPILTDARRVFITIAIAGICQASLFQVVSQSSVPVYAITLPLLTVDHMSYILAKKIGSVSFRKCIAVHYGTAALIIRKLLKLLQFTHLF
jgi:hypothetical protein